MEGHNIVVQVIGQTVKVSNGQRLGSELYNTAVRFHDDHLEQELLNICLAVSEPGQINVYISGGLSEQASERKWFV